MNARGLGWMLVVLMTASVLGVVDSPPAARASSLGIVDGEELDVAADRVDVDVARGVAKLDGAVTVHLGDLEMHCPTAEIRYDKSPRVSFARGSGGVTARFQGIDATASSVEFDASARTVALQGAVRLTRGRGWITADRATVDLSSSKVALEGVKGSIPVDPGRH